MGAELFHENGRTWRSLSLFAILRTRVRIASTADYEKLIIKFVRSGSSTRPSLVYISVRIRLTTGTSKSFLSSLRLARRAVGAVLCRTSFYLVANQHNKTTAASGCSQEHNGDTSFRTPPPTQLPPPTKKRKLKAKVKSVAFVDAMMAYGGEELYPHSCLTLALECRWWLASCFGSFIPEDSAPSINWREG